MAGSTDGLDAGNAEVKDKIRGAERSKETAAGSIYMDVNADAGLVFIIIQGLGNFRRQFISTRIGHSERGNHNDGVLINLFQHPVNIHLPFSGRHRDFTHFNIPIAAELVPADLDRAAYQVGLVNGFAGGFPAGSPAPQGGHASKHACFTGTDSGTTNRLFILAGIPKIGNNGSAAHLNSGCLGIFILVNHVLVNAEIHQHPDLLFIPGLAEGCKVLAGIAVQHQFIGHQLESVLRAHRIIRELILGEKVICLRRTENGIFRPGCIGFLIWIKHDGIYCFIVSGPTVKGNPHEG